MLMLRNGFGVLLGKYGLEIKFGLEMKFSMWLYNFF